ncbi:MAG: flagellar biosynthesis protein FlhF [Zoogloeaceae bacterium]|jgi:flagellar biosynthesis protein FlhF|nr:flagellar biosynthesis protein FlhF [Zoogloeaceae bacterium]
MMNANQFLDTKKFVADSSKDALRKVRETLGPDANIHSNKVLPGGKVEVIASAFKKAPTASQAEDRGRKLAGRYQDEDDAYRVGISQAALHASSREKVSRPGDALPPRHTPLAPREKVSRTNEALSPRHTPMVSREQVPRVSDALPSLHADLLSRVEHIDKRAGRTSAQKPTADSSRSSGKPDTPPAKAGMPKTGLPRPSGKRDTPLVNAGIRMTDSLRRLLPMQPKSSDSSSIALRDMAGVPAEVLSEIRTLRKVIEQHLAGFIWGETARQQPVKTEVLRQMLEVGFSPCFSRELLADLPPKLDFQQAIAWSREMVDMNLITASADLIGKGGVYALTGPTGVGKTTTTAKLAARCVLRHGANRVALVTTDSYRACAYDQLRAYGHILGSPVYKAKDAEELQQILGELTNKHMVLIDTMGMSQKDKQVVELNNMLAACGVRRLLLLSATVRGDTLDDVVRAYRGDGLAGCVLTKIDEATSLAPAIDAVIRHGLCLDYVSNGQNVPEDLHLPNRAYLLHRAFKDMVDPAHRLTGLEPGLVMANAGLFTPKGEMAELVAPPRVETAELAPWLTA